MKINKKSLRILLLINLIIVMLSLFCFIQQIRHLPAIDPEKINTSTWLGNNLIHRDGVIYADRNTMENGEKIPFLWGPYTRLKKGSYTAAITYETDEDQSCFAGDRSNKGEDQLYLATTGILSRHKNFLNYQFELTEDVEKFQLVIEYNGKGSFGVRSISIVPNNNRAKRLLTGSLSLLLLADLAFFFMTDPDRRKRKTAAVLAGIIFLVSLPAMVKGIYYLHDLEFHLMRIESIANAIRSRQFPARISTIALWGLGYPFSIYYNDIFLYFPAILRLLGFSVASAYKAYLILINVLTVLLAYYSFKNMTKSRQTGLVMTLLYAAASYRLVNIYVRAAVGEYTAQAFLPLLALAFFRIYSDEEQNARTCFKNALLLTAAASGIIGSHILTLLMAGFVSVLFCLLLWNRTFRRTTISTFVMGGFMTAAVNLYFIVPFLDYYFSVSTFISSGVREGGQTIQRAGLYLGQLFAFFQNVTGHDIPEVNRRFQTTPGPALMLVLAGAVFLILNKKSSKFFRLILFFSVLTLFLATDLFPWNHLSLHIGLFRILSQIQFPWRFLSLTILFLTLLYDRVQKDSGIPNTALITAVLAVTMVFWFASNLFSTEGHKDYYDFSGSNVAQTGHEYLITGTDWEAYDPTAEHAVTDTVEMVSVKSDRYLFRCKTDKTPGSHWITVPIFNYKGYHVYAEGEELPIENGDQNHIAFDLPAGFDGRVEVRFREPVYWTYALYLSAAAFILILIALLSTKRKNISVIQKY